MMSNLFSIFDPAGQLMLSGWLISLVLLLAPVSLWANSFGWAEGVNQSAMGLKTELDGPLGPGQASHLTVLLWVIGLFLATTNMLGLLPYVFTPSAHLILPVCLALPLWASGYFYSWLISPSKALAHLVPKGSPFVLMPFMVLIETVSALIRPLTLSVRLMANMVAGHLLLSLIGGGFEGFFSFLPLFVSQAVLVALELAVAVIQGYVFVVLITLYAKEVSAYVI